MTTRMVPISLLALCACAPVEPTIQQGPDSEITFDGLHRIDNARFTKAWADPDVDYSAYKKILPGEAFFEFRAVKKTSSTSPQRSAITEYWISERDRQKLIDEVSAVFREELQKSTRFTVADQPGPDVLIVRGGLHDIISRVPPEAIGRSEIYLRSIGEATLVLEAFDSMSGETIYRAVERRGAGYTASNFMTSDTATTWAEVRRLARLWATTLREGLDSLPAS